MKTMFPIAAIWVVAIVITGITGCGESAGVKELSFELEKSKGEVAFLEAALSRAAVAVNYADEQLIGLEADVAYLETANDEEVAKIKAKYEAIKVERVALQKEVYRLSNN